MNSMSQVLKIGTCKKATKNAIFWKWLPTIAIGSNNISNDILSKIEKIICKKCEIASCAMKRWGVLLKLHIQMIH